MVDVKNKVDTGKVAHMNYDTLQEQNRGKCGYEHTWTMSNYGHHHSSQFYTTVFNEYRAILETFRIGSTEKIIGI